MELTCNEPYPLDNCNKLVVCILWLILEIDLVVPNLVVSGSACEKTDCANGEEDSVRLSKLVASTSEFNVM
jgi:hypothetical protein